jgi:type IV pilus biogenesis protein PilP
MQTSLKRLILAGALGLTLPAASYGQASTAADLTQLEAETTLLKARARQLEVRSQIATRQAEISRLASAAAPAVGGSSLVVRAIEGIGTPLYATLQLSNGRLLDVKAGDALPNGWQVVAVAPDAVLVQRKGGKPFKLAAQDVTRAQLPQSAMAPLPAGMPALPPPALTRAAQ